MTTEETQRAAAWSKMTKSQRMAFIRQGAVLNTTSSERQAAVKQLIKKASGR
jgi:hypothetical protein